MTVQQYIDNINSAFKRGNATEHTYRGDLKQLIESILKDIAATNEPKRQSCGAPDYILTKKDIPVDIWNKYSKETKYSSFYLNPIHKNKKSQRRKKKSI